MWKLSYGQQFPLEEKETQSIPNWLKTAEKVTVMDPLKSQKTPVTCLLSSLAFGSPAFSSDSTSSVMYRQSTFLHAARDTPEIMI